MRVISPAPALLLRNHGIGDRRPVVPFIDDRRALPSLLTTVT